MSDFTLCSIREHWVQSCTPAVMVPIKGKKCPPAPGITRITRASQDSCGDSEMYGYYVKGSYYAKPKPDVTYDSSVFELALSDEYNTGFSTMVHCDGPIAVAIHMSNPDWYPKRGQVRIWDARQDGYARPYQTDSGNYIMSVYLYNCYWYNNIWIPDDIAEMEVDEIIDYFKASGEKRHAMESPDGIDQYVVIDGKTCSLPYAIWDGNLSQQRGIDATYLAKYGERIWHNKLCFESERLETGIYDAYMQAIEALPKDEINWFATILDLVELIIAGVTGNIRVVAKNLPQFAADAWLSYRYVYNTTKMDIDDMGELRSRMQKLKGMCDNMRNPTITTFGMANADGAVVRVSLTYSVSEILKVDNFLENTQRMLAYDAWDLIPFSFIVDWFYSVGDLLHDESLRSYAMKLQPAAAWCSVSYTMKSKDGTNVKRYFRYRLAGVPGRPSTYSYRVGPNATTLSVKHSIDSLAIIIGML